MRFHQVLTVLTAFASSAVAGTVWGAPTAGNTYTAGTAFTITISDDGVAPAFSALDTYSMYVGVGGNTAGTYDQLTELVTDSPIATLTHSVTVPAGISGTAANGYFIIMIAQGTSGGTLKSFSNRFSMTGMTGTLSTIAAAGVKTVTGTTGPQGSNNVVGATAASSAVAGDALYTVPYHLQTGLIKYAPMQPVPGTKITAKTATPLNPTSAYTIATTYMGAPSITTTQTETQTHSVASSENFVASAQPRTSDDLGNWLKRWAD